MKRKYVDGYRHNSIVVLQKLPNKRYLVRCDCGKVYSVGIHTIKSIKSCKECSIKAHIVHGQSDTQLYHMWEHMKQRCLNDKTKHFEDYGGRGISICNEWIDSKPFIDWALSNGYKEGLTLDRIDVNGNYSPENCRFVDRRTQQNNRRNTIFITAFGETLPCAEWARRTGIAKNTIRGRIITGWAPDKAVSEPVQQHRRRKHEP